MERSLALDLGDITVEPIGAEATAGEVTLESLMSGHGMEDMAASVLPSWCCSCSVPCCCS